MFFALLLATLSLLFLNLSKTFSGKKRFVIPSILILWTFLSFSFRENTFFCTCQAVLLIFVCLSLSLYIFWNLFLLVSKVAQKSLQEKISKKIYRSILLLSLLLTIGFFLYGIPNNQNYNIKTATIKLPKETQSFTVAFFTDLHLDPLFKKEKLDKIAFHLDSLKPDYIFFGGDLADIKDSVLDYVGFDKYLKTITSKAKKQTFGILGNHEAYAERNGSSPRNWMKKVGMTVLLDSTICTEDFCLTGRKDFQVARLENQERVSLKNLAPKNSDLPWLILDHQPKGIEKEYSGEIPLLALSGHTHNGQFFPGTLLIDLIWPLSYGFGNINGVPWLVSSGIDSWGPPVRVGSNTELWFLTFKH